MEGKNNGDIPLQTGQMGQFRAGREGRGFVQLGITSSDIIDLSQNKLTARESSHMI